MSELEPLAIGSIKDRIVCSVWALGELATPKALNKAVDCNSAVLGIAIESLQRDGYMHLGEGGHFMLHEELAATLKPAERKETAATAHSQTSSLEVVFTQGNDQVICSLEQLQVLRDWASTVVKKAMAST